MADIQFNFSPIKFQTYLLNNIKHRNVLVIHRQAGKTYFNSAYILMRAIQNSQQYQKFGFIFPERGQAKKSSWTKLKELSANIPGVSFNEAELSITFAHNKNTIYLLGVQTSENIRGLSLNGIIVDECQDIDLLVWEIVLSPTISRTNGWVIFSGTPKGRGNNLLWKMYETSQQEIANGNNKWFNCLLTIHNSKVYEDDPERIEEIRKTTSPAVFAQEYECSFDGITISSYWGKEVEIAYKERYKPYPYDARFPVYTAWDLGMADSTAIWFFQIKNNSVYFIDYEEDTDKTIPQWCNIVLNKRYNYKAHYGPHDLAQRSITSIVSETRADVARNFGIDFEIIPRVKKIDQIESGRLLIDRAFFNSESPLMDHAMMSLSMCRPKFFNGNAVRDSVVHDEYSHAQDALMYAAQAINDIQYNLNSPKFSSYIASNFDPYE